MRSSTCWSFFELQPHISRCKHCQNLCKYHPVRWHARIVLLGRLCGWHTPSVVMPRAAIGAVPGQALCWGQDNDQDNDTQDLPYHHSESGRITHRTLGAGKQALFGPQLAFWLLGFGPIPWLSVIVQGLHVRSLSFDCIASWMLWAEIQKGDGGVAFEVRHTSQRTPQSPALIADQSTRPKQR